MSTRRKEDEKEITATTLDTEPVIQDVTTEEAAEKLSLERTASMVEEALTGPLIYLGPNLPGGRLLQSTVFRGGIPVYLQPLLAEQPDIEALIVPVDKIAGVQERIVKTGTAEYVAYQAILKGGSVNGG